MVERSNGPRRPRASPAPGRVPVKRTELALRSLRNVQATPQCGRRIVAVLFEGCGEIDQLTCLDLEALDGECATAGDATLAVAADVHERSPLRGWTHADVIVVLDGKRLPNGTRRELERPANTRVRRGDSEGQILDGRIEK